MKPVNQLIRNEQGDCLRACIATLLDLSAEDVPNFAEDAVKPDVNGWPAWWFAMQSWLKSRGLFFLEMKLETSVPWMPLPYAGYCIFLGLTAAGNSHAVVGAAGDNGTESQFNLLHDPFPNAGGITSIGSVCFLIPLNPAGRQEEPSRIIRPANFDN